MKVETLIDRFRDHPDVVVRESEYDSGWWEEGGIIIPSACWKPCRRRVRHLYNQNQQWLYEKAMLAYESVRESRPIRTRWDHAFLQDKTVRRMTAQVAYMIRPALFYRHNTNMYLPSKRRFPVATLDCRAFQFAYDALATLDDENRVFKWSLRGETGYTAHAIPAVKELFDYVSSIPYCRQSGGVIRTRAGDLAFGPLGLSLL